MYLNRVEEKIYNGEFGVTLQKCMEILVALGKIYEADRLIPIKSAQISGVSYKTIGEAGLEYLKSLKGKVKIPALLNPAGLDRKRWIEMGISKEFAAKQMAILKAYEKLGVKTTCTCTPYYLHRIKKGDHLAWGESSAVIYANSVIGAMTNREGAPAALAAAFIGKTPNYGMHRKENRAPQVLVEIKFKLQDSDYAALGYVVGKQLGDKIPIFIFAEQKPTKDELKALGAALSASGGAALFHVKDITPENADYTLPREKISIEPKELEDVYGDAEDVELIAIGCPHCSSYELKKIAKFLDGKKVKRDTWIFTSRYLKEKNRSLVKKIEKSGAKIYCDTCVVVSPAAEGFSKVLTNSGKALNYLPSLQRVEACFNNLINCLRRACE
ncbi:MAG: aconitase X catalytic domain-containing protein [Methanocellales archaeon]